MAFVLKLNTLILAYLYKTMYLGDTHLFNSGELRKKVGYISRIQIVRGAVYVRFVVIALLRCINTDTQLADPI